MMPLFRDMRKRKSWLWIAIVFGFLFLFLAQSASAGSSLERRLGIVRGDTGQGLPYMSGGVGLDAREYMDRWDEGYNLKLIFAEVSGSYVAEVRVVVEDEKGAAVVDTTSLGPWFYARLRPGHYQVEATFEGETKQIKDLRVTKGDWVHRYFHWRIDERFAGSREAKTKPVYEWGVK